jgi:hypothetical protein
MKNLKYYLLIFSLVFFLLGCASTPVPTSDAIQIPDSRVLEGGRQYLSPIKNSGQFIVKRDTGIMGVACSTKIYLNGKGIADLDVSEKVVLNLPEGDYIVSAEPNGVCGGGLTEVKFNVKANSQSVFRYGTSGNGSPSIYPTAF